MEPVSQAKEENMNRQAVTGSREKPVSGNGISFSMKDNRQEAFFQKKVHQMVSNSPLYNKIVGLKENISNSKSQLTQQKPSINIPVTQREKQFIRYNQMSYSDDFRDRHLANNLDDAFTQSARRCYDDNLNESTVIVANAELRRNLLKDFADDYNDDNHDEHDNIVSSRAVTVIHTQYIETYEFDGQAVYVYDTQRWDDVVIQAGVATNVQLLGQIGHLHGYIGGNANGSVYRTSFLENGNIDWFNEQ